MENFLLHRTQSECIFQTLRLLSLLVDLHRTSWRSQWETSFSLHRVLSQIFRSLQSLLPIRIRQCSTVEYQKYRWGDLNCQSASRLRRLVSNFVQSAACGGWSQFSVRQPPSAADFNFQSVSCLRRPTSIFGPRGLNPQTPKYFTSAVDGAPVIFFLLKQ